jgi:hypothetical protein
MSVSGRYSLKTLGEMFSPSTVSISKFSLKYTSNGLPPKALGYKVLKGVSEKNSTLEKASPIATRITGIKTSNSNYVPAF